jgi:hypothetical protein
MKHQYITGSWIFLLLLISCAQEKPADVQGPEGDGEGPKAEIRFDRTEHDLGTIVQGETVGYNFAFTNTGEGSLVILDASASCGCTVPSYSKEPVPPGGKGSVEVRFDSSGRTGQQSKTVTIRTNGKTPLVKLTILANIIDFND